MTIACLLLLPATGSFSLQPAYVPHRLFAVEELVNDLRYFQHQLDNIHTPRTL